MNKPKRKYEIPITECLCHECGIFVVRGEGNTICEECSKKKKNEHYVPVRLLA